MNIAAEVVSGSGRHEVRLQTNGNIHAIAIPPKTEGTGSSVNGGELLLLAVATCYCNDIYREAAKRAIAVTSVEVRAEGEFGGEGEPARRISYSARVAATATEQEILSLMKHTDTVAEIHNTLRKGIPVALTRMEAAPVPR